MCDFNIESENKLSPKDKEKRLKQLKKSLADVNRKLRKNKNDRNNISRRTNIQKAIDKLKPKKMKNEKELKLENILHQFNKFKCYEDKYKVISYPNNIDLITVFLKAFESSIEKN